MIWHILGGFLIWWGVLTLIRWRDSKKNLICTLVGHSFKEYHPDVSKHNFIKTLIKLNLADVTTYLLLDHDMIKALRAMRLALGYEQDRHFRCKNCNHKKRHMPWN